VLIYGGIVENVRKGKCLQMDDDDEDEEEEEEAEDIPEAQTQEAAEFGWFNDLYFLETGIVSLLLLASYS
jgi:hypothetical protein